MFWIDQMFRIDQMLWVRQVERNGGALVATEARWNGTARCSGQTRCPREHDVPIFIWYFYGKT